MTFKRFLPLTLITLFSLLSTNVKGQDITFAEYEKFVAGINSTLPLSTGPLMEFTNIEVNRTTLTMRYTFNDVGNTISKKFFTQEELREHFKMMLSGIEGDMQTFLSVACDFDLELRLVCLSENTGDKQEITIPTEDLRQILTTEVTAEEKLQYQIKSTQRMLPLSMGAGMTLTEVKLTSTYCITTCIVDANIVSIDQFIKNKDSIRKTIEDMILKQTDLTTVMQAAMCADTGRGISYIYKCDTTGKTLRIDISNDQLVSLLTQAFGEDGE